MNTDFGTKQITARITSPARATQPDAGHTLAQALAAITVLGLAVIAFSGAFATAYCVIHSSREQLRASQIVMERAESLRLFNWSQVSAARKHVQPLFVQSDAPSDVTEDSGGVQYVGYLTGAASLAGGSAKDAHAHMRNVTLALSSTTCNGDQAAVRTSQVQIRLARNGAPKYVWPAL